MIFVAKKKIFLCGKLLKFANFQAWDSPFKHQPVKTRMCELSMIVCMLWNQIILEALSLSRALHWRLLPDNFQINIRQKTFLNILQVKQVSV